jgi:hypothetical protein
LLVEEKVALPAISENRCKALACTASLNCACIAIMLFMRRESRLVEV